MKISKFSILAFLFILFSNTAWSSSMKMRNYGSAAYTSPGANVPPALTANCSNANCLITGSLPPGTTLIEVTGSTSGGSYSASQAVSGSSFSHATGPLSPGGVWNFSVRLVNAANGTFINAALNGVGAYLTPGTPDTPTVTCGVGSCSISGTVPANTMALEVIGIGPGGASSITQVVSPVSGSPFTTPVSNLAVGGWQFKLRASNQSGESVFSSQLTGSQTVQSSVASALQSGERVTLAQLESAGISRSILDDLNTNSKCGSIASSAATNCLQHFNDYKASSGCTLENGGNASNSSVSNYVQCVMVAAYQAQANSITLSTASTAKVGCSAASTVALPSACSYPQWSCSLAGTPPSGWSKVGNNIEIASSASPTAAGSPQTYSISMTLNNYSSSPISKSGAIAVSSAFNGGRNHHEFSQSATNQFKIEEALSICSQEGGRLMTKTEYQSNYGNSELNLLFATNSTQTSVSYSSNYSQYNQCRTQDMYTAGNPWVDRKIWKSGGGYWTCGGALGGGNTRFACTGLPSC